MDDLESKVGESPEEAMRRMSRRSFAWGAVATVSTVGVLKWVSSQPSIPKFADSRGIPGPLRRVLDMNGQVSESWASEENLAEIYPESAVESLRVNAHHGMPKGLKASDFLLDIEGWGPVSQLAVSDLRRLKKSVVVTKFKCIEGWSTVVRFAGCRFRDFMAAIVPPESGEWNQTKLAKLPRYAFMATPNRAYYVGLDMKALLHPQTLLAWESNGVPLTEDHGAPLRLFMPTKYGIKSIKRLGLVRFQDDRPTDYWYERGYDWYSGH